MLTERSKKSATIAKRSGQVDEEGRPAPMCSNSAAFVATMVAASLCLVFFITGHAASVAGTASSTKLPIHPPKPYTYQSFMTWLRTTDFSSETSLKWKPEVEEFDLDAAAASKKYGPYMAGTEATTALNVAKSINKFVFMDEIMLSGDLTSIGGPGTHLYVLTKLLAAAADSSRPTFLDAGCGTGYLLMAWAVATGSGSQAIGIDINAANVAAAKRHLANPEALDNLVAHVPADASMDVRVGDALNPDAARLGLKRRSVDAINVGLAVESEAELAPLAELLRAGGVMAAPVCEPLAKRQPVPEGRCDSRFKIFRKKEDGSLQREDGDPDIPVTFIVAQRSKGSGSANLRGR